MKCRKCGSEIPNNTIRCKNCGVRVNIRCPKCKSLVPFGEKNCADCGFEIIKTCPECGASNIYTAKNCRKCNFDFDNMLQNIVSTDIQIETVEENSANEKIQEEAATIPSVENEIVIEELKEEVSEIHVYKGTEELKENKELKQENSDKDTKQVDSETAKENDNSDYVDSFSATNVNCPAVEGASIELPTKQSQDMPEVQDGIKHAQDETEIATIEEFAPVSNIPTDEETSIKIKELFFEDNSANLKEATDSEQEKDEIDDLLTKPISIESLEEVEESEESKDDNQDEGFNSIQNEAVTSVVGLIKSSITKHVIAIRGPEGSGKTAILKQVEKHLDKSEYLFLYGSCTPLIQITSFGFFQDAFLRLMGFPPYTKSVEAFTAAFKRSNFAKSFNFLTTQELNLFLNMIYPYQQDSFENIMINKEKMFSILEKVIKSFSVNNNLILAIDNFEILDGASYDFIVYLMNKGYFNNRLKLLISYQENKSIQSYFDISNIDEDIFEEMNLVKLSDMEMLQSVKKAINIDIEELFPEDLVEKLLKKADGNALRLEQEIALLFDTGYININGSEIIINDNKKFDIDTQTFEELIKLRLNSLTPAAKNVLFMAAIMGYRFSINILCLSVEMNDSKAAKLLEYLCQELFIHSVDNYTCEFKSLTLWKLIYQEATKDILYKENAQKLYETIKPLILSSNLQKLISCKTALGGNESFLIWQDTSDLCAKLGDTNLYVIALKQCLKILEENEIENAETIRAKIYEQIGKILCEKSPQEAITYLSNVLDAEIKVCNMNKIVDISAYFVKSCYLAGNYFGAAEAIDAIVSNANNSKVRVAELDLALIKTRKLKALINIGNCEQIINVVNQEIIPEIANKLFSETADNQLKSILIDAWLTSKIILAKAYALQGNNIVFKELAEIKEFIDDYQYEPNYYNLQLKLLEAFAKTIFGDINDSNEILNSISSKCRRKTIDTELLSQWNLINIINRVLTEETDGLKADLFELATFTNNINEHFTKNIIKLILGYIIQQEGNERKALSIYNEEITYFSKEKVAIGALLSWLLIVQMNIGENDETALNTASKALEIAQSSKINNFIFSIYFQKSMAEVYLRQKDYASAKMYLEKSIMVAKEQGLKYQLIELYVNYGDLMQEIMKSEKNYQPENISITSDLYEKALDLANEIDLRNMIYLASKHKNGFKTFLQLNSII